MRHPQQIPAVLHRPERFAEVIQLPLLRTGDSLEHHIVADRDFIRIPVELIVPIQVDPLGPLEAELGRPNPSSGFYFLHILYRINADLHRPRFYKLISLLNAGFAIKPEPERAVLELIPVKEVLCVF